MVLTMITKMFILQLTAPNKDFVYVLGNFNDYKRDASSLMKINPNNNKFWIKLSGLKEDFDYWYQYEVYSKSPVNDSPTVVKVADPFSNVILSKYDDSQISSNSYSNLLIFQKIKMGNSLFRKFMEQ